jgi:hypothetical protein
MRRAKQPSSSSKRSFSAGFSFQRIKTEKYNYLEIELTLYDNDCEVVVNCKKVCVFLLQQVALVKRLSKEVENQQHDYLHKSLLWRKRKNLHLPKLTTILQPSVT